MHGAWTHPDNVCDFRFGLTGQQVPQRLLFPGCQRSLFNHLHCRRCRWGAIQGRKYARKRPVDPRDRFSMLLALVKQVLDFVGKLDCGN